VPPARVFSDLYSAYVNPLKRRNTTYHGRIGTREVVGVASSGKPWFDCVRPIEPSSSHFTASLFLFGSFGWTGHNFFFMLDIGDTRGCFLARIIRGRVNSVGHYPNMSSSIFKCLVVNDQMKLPLEDSPLRRFATVHTQTWAWYGALRKTSTVSNALLSHDSRAIKSVMVMYH